MGLEVCGSKIKQTNTLTGVRRNSRAEEEQEPILKSIVSHLEIRVGKCYSTKTNAEELNISVKHGRLAMLRMTRSSITWIRLTDYDHHETKK